MRWWDGAAFRKGRSGRSAAVATCVCQRRVLLRFTVPACSEWRLDGSTASGKKSCGRVRQRSAVQWSERCAVQLADWRASCAHFLLPPLRTRPHPSYPSSNSASEWWQRAMHPSVAVVRSARLIDRPREWPPVGLCAVSAWRGCASKCIQSAHRRMHSAYDAGPSVCSDGWTDDDTAHRRRSFTPSAWPSKRGRQLATSEFDPHTHPSHSINQIDATMKKTRWKKNNITFIHSCNYNRLIAMASREPADFPPPCANSRNIRLQ